MKKIFLLTLIYVFCTSILIAIEIHVYPEDSIQQAVDNADSYDVIIVHPYDEDPYYYAENVNLDSFNGDYLTITGEDPSNWTTVENTHVRYANSALPVFYTTNVNTQEDITINIIGIKFESGNMGIHIVDTANYDYNLNVEYCIFRSPATSIKTQNHTPLFVDNCIFRLGVIGIDSSYYWDGLSQTDFLLNITGCEFANLQFYNVRSYCPANIDKCSFVQHNSIAQQPVALWTRGLLNSSIIAGDWSGGCTIIGNYRDSLTVQYSDIEGGVPQHEFIINGNGNIDTDPLFYDPDNMNFHLTEASPCIDAGNPFSPLDPDDTRADMGCYYFHHDYDIHHLYSGYNWKSFPRIGTEPNGNVPTDLVDVLDDIYPFTGITNINMQADEDPELELTYDLVNFWDPNPYLAQSSWLYKIEILPGEERILTVDGEKLPITFDLSDEDPLEAGEYHWLGFWLPGTQNMIESFGEYWQYVAKVKSEEWFYSPAIVQRGGDPTYPIALSAENLTLSYGKGYMVLFKDLPQPITDFHWTVSAIAEEPEKKAEPENFTYTEKADYEAIDVFNIPPNVTEIGVFEDEVCVGAVVVEDTCAQILVYSDYANRDPIPFTLEVVTGRGFSTPIKDYKVMNMETGKYESRSIISGRQDYSVLRFEYEEEPENNTLSTPQLHGNHPNPFNPTTTISFSLPNEEDIELSIYNIKGQKVKTLYSGIAEEGKHSMIWDGKDTNDKTVCTGIYFYKLKTGNQVLTRKMLMLK
ncbi:MAG: T9SS type A sorting domain-containing protein [Bacteroidetes bacterium]|nr:T9SS type A sorting domain-containing protein [Bacteroidota bacterium]